MGSHYKTMLRAIASIVLASSMSTEIPNSFAEETQRHLVPEMVYLPGGAVEIGSLAHVVSQPVHEVTIAPFFMGKYEVTYSEFDIFTTATGREARNDLGWGRGNRPVVDISWHDANEYAVWLSEITGDVYRLPSEAEWEYAARAGKRIPRYSWGNDVGSNEANCGDCGSKDGGKSTSAVGSFSSNDFGIYDMHGNVWEIVRNCYSHSYFEADLNIDAGSQDDCKNVVVRGGSWETSSDEIAFWFRGSYLKDSVSSDVGFRLVREVGGSSNRKDRSQ